MHSRTTTWQGGGSPFAIGSKPLGMWLFIVSDALTFSTLLVCYTYLRLANPNWPAPFHLWPSIAQATLMTAILLSSSLTMAMGVESMKRDDRKSTVKYLLLTVACGLAFIVIHLGEWRHLMTVEKVTFTGNPWSEPLFGATFFSLTGLHMLHVAAGMVYLLVIAVGTARGKFSLADVETSGLYWHFVDLVWMFLFPLLYLVSVKL